MPIRTRSLSLIALLFAAAGCSGPVEEVDGHSATASLSGTFNLRFVHSGKCLDVAGGPSATQNGANVQQWTCFNSTNQQFRIRDLGGGDHLIEAVHSGRCADIAGWGTHAGANVLQWDCHGGNNQRFHFIDKGNGQFQIRSKHSGKCLDVSGGSPNDGANVHQWDCHHGNNQRVVLVPTGSPPKPTNNSCKRGIASNATPGSGFLPEVGWWKNWATRGGSTPLEFVPMLWDERSLGESIPSGSRFLLGFNEPNFGVQADLTPAQAAAYWPQVEAKARQLNIPIVSPAMNFCGGDCNGTDPYQYLRDFFAACPGCKVDYIAVHWYNCDVPSLEWYLNGFAEFGRPIWLTEFACAYGGDTSVAGQEAYMRQAVPFLESRQDVFRYAWFSADPIPQAELVNDNGTPTYLGRVYASLPGGCN